MPPVATVKLPPMSLSVGAPVASFATNCQRVWVPWTGFYADIRVLQQSAENEIRVGYLIGTALGFLPDIVREFELSRPAAPIRLAEFDFNDPDAGLATQSLDRAIIRPPIDIEDVQIVELARERCIVCLPVGHQLALQETVKVGQILDEPFIAAPKPGVWRDYWLAGDHRHENPANVALEVATVDSELRAVTTGKGISIMAESTAKYYARPGVVFRPIDDMAECVIAIGFRSTSSPRVRDLIAIAKKVADSHIQSAPEVLKADRR